MRKNFARMAEKCDKCGGEKIRPGRRKSVSTGIPVEKIYRHDAI